MGNFSISNLTSGLKHKSVFLAASAALMTGCGTADSISAHKRKQTKPKQIVKLPKKPVVKPAKVTKVKSYTIQPGDTLCNISRKFYGEAKYWKKIYELNKEAYPNPNALMIGQKLKLPVIDIPKKEAKPILAKKTTSKTNLKKGPQKKLIKLTDSEILQIGKQIFNNECGGNKRFLTTWNKGEDFPSFGIGHFIWYPKGVDGKFVETFPAFIEFAHNKGTILPPPLVPSPNNFDAPWKDRNEFMKNINSRDMNMIRDFLANHIALQTEFIINRSESALPKMLEGLSDEEKESISTKYYKIANSKGGMYPLIDYVNFKGEGTSPKERYKHQGWGLLQVLEQMKDDTKIGDETLKEFVRSANFILELRVINSPVANNEIQWLPGWKNRVKTYLPKKRVIPSKIKKQQRKLDTKKVVEESAVKK